MKNALEGSSTLNSSQGVIYVKTLTGQYYTRKYFAFGFEIKRRRMGYRNIYPKWLKTNYLMSFLNI